jgi:hypothetical protein
MTSPVGFYPSEFAEKTSRALHNRHAAKANGNGDMTSRKVMVYAV